MHHKIIAIRIRGKGDQLLVESLGQSPRGSRFLIQTIKIDGAGLTPKSLKAEVEKAALQLIPVPLPFE